MHTYPCMYACLFSSFVLYNAIAQMSNLEQMSWELAEKENPREDKDRGSNRSKYDWETGNNRQTNDSRDSKTGENTRWDRAEEPQKDRDMKLNASLGSHTDIHLTLETHLCRESLFQLENITQSVTVTGKGTNKNTKRSSQHRSNSTQHTYFESKH